MIRIEIHTDPECLHCAIWRAIAAHPQAQNGAAVLDGADARKPLHLIEAEIGSGVYRTRSRR